MLNSIIKAWAKFERWVHSWFPGFKTYITTGVGALGMAAGSMYDYITGMPETKWLSKEALMGASFVLFTLSFWFNRMGDRVQARE